MKPIVIRVKIGYLKLMSVLGMILAGFICIGGIYIHATTIFSYILIEQSEQIAKMLSWGWPLATSVSLYTFLGIFVMATFIGYFYKMQRYLIEYQLVGKVEKGTRHFVRIVSMVGLIFAILLAVLIPFAGHGLWPKFSSGLRPGYVYLAHLVVYTAIVTALALLSVLFIAYFAMAFRWLGGLYKKPTSVL